LSSFLSAGETENLAQQMLKSVSLQAIVSLGVALVALLLSGVNAAWSALLGGLVCVIPNALLAFRLTWAMRRTGHADPASFLIGEFVKVALSIAILAAVAMHFHHLNWLAFLVGLIAAFKSYLVAFLFDRKS
jgi:ATP synthase protein I